MTNRFLGLACLLGLVGCARPVPPAGGPEDLAPPRLVASQPESGAVRVSPRGEIRLRFSEWINPATAKSAVVLMPIGARSPEIKVDGPDLVLLPKEPLDSPATYVLRIQPGLADWRNAATKTVLEIPFSTGDRIDSGRVTVRFWAATDTTAPAAIKGRLGAWPLDSGYRRSLSKLLRRKDSVGWLRQPPLPWREKPWRWIWSDSSGVADLRFLPTGRWRLFAWDDRDKDNFWRPGDEAGTWLGDVDGAQPGWSETFRARLAPMDTLGAPAVVRDTTKDSLVRRDSLSLDSLDRRWASLPPDSTGSVLLVSDSLPPQWQRALVRIRVWPVFKRARPRLSAASTSPGLRLAPGKWSGEVWQDLNADAKVGVSDLQRATKAEPWCVLRSFDILQGDSLRLSPDCRIRLLPTDTSSLKRANP